MRFLREEPSAREKDVLVPVIKISKRELEIILGCLEGGSVYIPDLFLPDKMKLKDMIRVVSYYLGQVPRFGGRTLRHSNRIKNKVVATKNKENETD